MRGRVVRQPREGSLGRELETVGIVYEVGVSGSTRLVVGLSFVPGLKREGSKWTGWCRGLWLLQPSMGPWTQGRCPCQGSPRGVISAEMEGVVDALALLSPRLWRWKRPLNLSIVENDGC